MLSTSTQPHVLSSGSEHLKMLCGLLPGMVAVGPAAEVFVCFLLCRSEWDSYISLLLVPGGGEEVSVWFKTDKVLPKMGQSPTQQLKVQTLF